MARTEFASALAQVASERSIDPQEVLETIKEAVKAAYRKDYAGEVELEDLEVELDPESGEPKILRDGKDVTPTGFGRIAAQTAKQVILQRIRESEKQAILSEYEKKVGTVVNGMVQRIEGPVVHVDLGKAEGICPPSEQTDGEHYRQNQRLKFFIKEIREGNRGSEIIVSRAAKELVVGLFKLEVPEVSTGVVEIKAISREAGKRTKVAVQSNQAGVDPVGSCVGQKGVRVQAVIAELGDEKIDIILYSDDPERFVAAALSPAKINSVSVNDEEKLATVYVDEDQLSLAIGKEGQNVRLAAKLTGYKIDIKGPEAAAEAFENVAKALSGKSQSTESSTELAETPAAPAKTKVAKAKPTTKTKAKAKAKPTLTEELINQVEEEQQTELNPDTELASPLDTPELPAGEENATEPVAAETAAETTTEVAEPTAPDESADEANEQTKDKSE